MPAVINLRSPAASIPAAVQQVRNQVKDLARNNVQAPYSLTVGLGGLSVLGPTNIGGSCTLTAGLTVTGGAINGSLTGNVTGNLTGNVSGNINGSGASSFGSITSGNVISSGQVQSNGAPLLSQPTFNYLVATGYKSVWIDGATFQLGYSPSTEIVKTSLQQMSADDARKLLDLTPYWGRYVWDSPDEPLRVFFLAADVQAVGFGEDVAPVVHDQPLVLEDPSGPIMVNGQPATVPVGEAYTINYSQMVVPLVAAYHDGAQQIQALTERVAALEARLQAAGIA